MNKLTSLLWENRTKVIGYLGSALITLGTSGLVSERVALWCALAATLLTSAIGHFNTHQAVQATQAPQGQQEPAV